MNPDQSESARQKAQFAMVFGMLVGAGLMAVGVVQAMQRGGDNGLVPVIGGVVLLAICPILYLMLTAILAVASSARRTAAAADEMREVAAGLRTHLETLAGDSQISGEMKSIIHRDKDRQALRNALRSSVTRGDWENAYFIIEQMDKKLGMREEASKFLSEVDQARRDTIEVKLDEALAHIDSQFAARQWERAQNEIDRLMKLFPDNESVQSLPQKMAAARVAHKNELLAQWDAAVSRNDIDRGIEILRDLDDYLSREEAEHLTEAARHVFKERLVNLGVQFELAVGEQRWRDALEVGVQINDEFPNSRMAKQVSANLDTLRIRSGMVADATMGPQADG